MRRTSTLSDRELDSLLAGRGPSGDGDQAKLAAFVRELRASYGQALPEETQTRHLAAIVEAARGLAASEEATATLARPGLSPDRERSPRSRPWRELLPGILLSPKRAKLVAVGALSLLLLAAFGGAAYAGQLPDPVQSKVADLADKVGVQLNDGQHNDVDEGDVGNVDEGAKGNEQHQGGNLDEGAKGNVDEGAKGNEQHQGGNVDGAKGNVEDGANGNDQPDRGNLDDGTTDDEGAKGDAGKAGDDAGTKGQNGTGNDPDQSAPTDTGASGGQGTGSDQGDGSN